MKKTLVIVLLITLILASTVLAYLHYNAASPLPDPSVQKSIENVRAMQILDASWSLATVKTRYAAHSDFDEVANFLERFRELRDRINRSELALDVTPAPIRNQLFQYLSLLNGKEQAIESFKSNLAVIRNSERYLPLASRTLSSRAGELGFAELAEEVGQLQSLLEEYLRSGDAGLKSRLLIRMSEMDERLVELPPTLVNLLNNVLSHARVLVERKAPMEETMARVTDSSANEVAERLLRDYTFYDAEEQAAMQQHHAAQLRYQQLAALVVVMIGLLAAILYLVEVLLFSRRLEQAVQVKTRELEQHLESAQHAVAGRGQQHHMAGMNSMVAALTHEINTPLGYLSSNLEVAEKSMQKVRELQEEVAEVAPSSPEQAAQRLQSLIATTQNLLEEAMVEEFPEIIQDMRDGVEQISHLVEELRDFSRKDSLEQDWFDLNDSVEKTLKMTGHKLEAQITIEKSLGKVPQLYGSVAEINQVLSNLLVNASHAVEGSQQPTIRVKTAKEGDWVVLDVLDSGVGMDQETMKRMFDPFFTTKGPGKGTGLGMAIVKRVVQRHRGKIFIKSKPGKGTQIRIALPVNSSQSVATE